MKMISRRRFVRNAALLGATLPFGYTTGQTSAQTATLNIYVAVWPSLTNIKLPWKTSSPRYLAQEFSHMVWEYFQSYKRLHDGDATRFAAVRDAYLKKTSIIGHASLFAEYRQGNTINHIVFSNTGGNPGIYRNPNMPISTIPPEINYIIDKLIFPSDKFPKKYRNDTFILCFLVNELLAGHVSDGKWESLSEYEKRCRPPDSKLNLLRVKKYEYKGTPANKIWNMLQNIMSQTDPQKKENENKIGAAKHFGLNANAVRLVTNFNQKLSLSWHNIENGKYTISGGCANAVAAILKIIGLGDEVPHSARFSINHGRGIDLNRFVDHEHKHFAGISVPIVTGKQEYNNRREPTDQKLRDALNSVPQTWGNGGDLIEFTDPNYWYSRIPDNKTIKEQFKNRVRFAVVGEAPLVDHP